MHQPSPTQGVTPTTHSSDGPGAQDRPSTRPDMSTEWHGNAVEGDRLRQAFALHCTCDPPNIENGTPGTTCAAHLTLQNDQRAMDGLLFFYQIAGDLYLEEFLAPKGEAVHCTEWAA
jgi:hypothetical protein